MSKIIKGNSKKIFGIMEELYKENKTAWVIVSGMSMYPFLKEGRDAVELTKPCIEKIKKGDIILIKRLNDEYVLHRVYEKGYNKCFIIGDAQTWIEGPISDNQIKGVVVKVRRNQKIISAEDRKFKLFGILWLSSRPIRSRIRQIKVNIKSH